MEPRTGKKIVSKGRYVGAQIKKMWIYFDALAILLFMPMLTYNSALPRRNLSPFWFTVLMVGITILSVLNFMKIAISRFREAKAIDAGVPLTRANSADLPAPDSLVRASSEPMQAQEAVLLRAVVKGQEKHEEHLVRASVGQE